MSSTEFKVDRRDIQFVVNEVFEAEKLCEFPNFSDFDMDTFHLIIEEAAHFAEKVIVPLNAVGDSEGCVLKEGQVVTPKGFKEAWQQMGENGWIGLNVPPEFGGQGVPELVSTAATDALVSSNQAFLIIRFLTSGAVNLIKTFGSQEQKATYCEKMATGKWAGTMCLTEPNAGTAVGDIITTATKEGDHYLIKGTKMFISSGDHDFTDNIIHMVLARLPDAPPGPKGISLFIVPKIRHDGTPNDVTVVNLEHKMGIHGSPTCLLSFGDNKQCHGELLQAENQGMSQMFQMMNESRLQIGLQGLAASAAAYEFALSYANERVQGIAIQHGKDQNAARSLIVEHPDVKRMLMSIKATTEGLRGLMYACGYFTDMCTHGPEDTREHYQNLLDLSIPIAKAFGTDEGFQAACLGIQVLGGVGYTRDFPLEQNARDAKIGSIYEGANGVQALDLVGRKFNMKNGALLQSLQQELKYFEQITIPKEIQGMLDEWNSYQDLLFESIQNLRELTKSGGPQGYVLYATNMLALMGDVLCAFYLLKQALVAQNKFEALEAEAASRESLLEESTDARFYWNKVRTAEHYILVLLPRALSNARIIKNGSFASLQAKLELTI
ncbi:MAG: acyl-CoA dehydrogenase [SAR324 cluster bacterium]|nr:acyl-CoA dehydrogenase [SAR324 cluster bacterium]